MMNPYYIDFGANSNVKDDEVDAITWHKCPDEDDVKSVAYMTPFDEFCAVCFFLFGVPGFIFTFPAMFTLAVWMSGSFLKTSVVSAVLLSSLMLVPTRFHEASLASPTARMILRYFSVKVIYYSSQLKRPATITTPKLFIVSPHGVISFGLCITMITTPFFVAKGLAIRGLVASSALRTPIFRQIMSGSFGAIDAARASAISALKKGYSLCISCGGVAEVFETNASNQTLTLAKRKGFVKLAFQTGADLVPCYSFGNTETLSIFAGGANQNLVRSISRKIGFAVILFWGRFGLPVPYRVPILMVFGEPIPCEMKPDPTSEEIDEKHALFLCRLKELFDRHKHSYNWSDKELVFV